MAKRTTARSAKRLLRENGIDEAQAAGVVGENGRMEVALADQLVPGRSIPEFGGEPGVLETSLRCRSSE